MAELSWTSEIIYYSECGQDQNWVSITPTQGTSSSSPIVSVKAATSPNDCPRASIIITTSNKETQIIPIVRCLPECTCKSINFVPKQLTELSAEGGSVELGTYDDGACVENMQVVTDGTVICEPIIQGGTVTATVQPNQSTSPRTGSYKVLLDADECYSRDNIVQEGKVDPCATAACPSVTPATMAFESEGGEKTYSFENYDENCWELIGVEKNDWITVNTASTKISVGSYTGTTQKAGNVAFNFVNTSDSSKTCSPSIGITQNGVTPPPVIECDCDSVTGVTETNIPKEGVGSNRFKIAELKITSTCSNKVAITGISDYTGNLGGNPDFEYDGNNVYIKNVSENSDLEAKTFSYKINYKVTGETVQDCEKDITDAKQNAGDACFYKLDDSAFAITCNTETQQQELEYKIINNSCSKTSESQEFTITIGGESYSVSGKPGDTGKKVVTVDADTTTVTWHNNGDTSVSGSKEISVGKCETECYVNVKDEINVSEVNVVYKVLNSNDEEVGRLESSSLSTTERRINLQGNTEGVLKVIAEYGSESMYEQISKSTSTGECSSTITCKCSRTVNIVGKLIENTSGDSKCYKLGTFEADHALFNSLVIIYAPYFWNGSSYETGEDVTLNFSEGDIKESENIEHCYGNCTWTHCHPCNIASSGCFASYSKCIIQGGTVIDRSKCEYTDTVTATKYILTYETPF